MSTALIRATFSAEIERARLAWNAVNGNPVLEVDFENQSVIDLAGKVDPYLMMDVVFRDGEQLDMGDRPLQRLDGQVMLAVGVKEGLGTLAASRVLDFVYPYLQLRSTLANGVQTAQVRPGAPKRANGFYYITAMIYFWRDAQAPVTP